MLSTLIPYMQVIAWSFFKWLHLPNSFFSFHLLNISTEDICSCYHFYWMWFYHLSGTATNFNSIYFSIFFYVHVLSFTNISYGICMFPAEGLPSPFIRYKYIYTEKYHKPFTITAAKSPIECATSTYT